MAEHKGDLGISTQDLVFTKKIGEVTNLLSKDNSGDFKETLSTILSSKLAEALFQKAPKDFIEHSTTPELVSIVIASAACIEDFTKAGTPFLIRTNSFPEYTEFRLVISNRPFIVDSVLETFRKFNLSLNCFLHPILPQEKGAPLSVMYSRIRDISDEKVIELEAALTEMCEDILLASDDNTAIFIRVETLVKLLEHVPSNPIFNSSEMREGSDFLKWLTDEHFNLFGHVKWEVNSNSTIEPLPKSVRGFMRSARAQTKDVLGEIYQDVSAMIDNRELINVTKTRYESTIATRARVDHIAVQELSQDGSVRAIHSFIGLFSQQALAEMSSKMPLVRKKLQKVLETENVVTNSYDYENIIRIVDSTPKYEVLRATSDELRQDIRKIMAVRNRQDACASVRYDRTGRGVYVMICLTRERFNDIAQSSIQEYLEKTFGATLKSSEYVVTLRLKPLARMYFYVPLSKNNPANMELAQIENELLELTKSWRDRVVEAISSTDIISTDTQDVNNFVATIPQEYQAYRTVEECVQDLQMIRTLSDETPIAVRLADSAEESNSSAVVSVYSLNKEIALSRSLPILENSGLFVNGENDLRATSLNGAPIYINDFTVRTRSNRALDKERFNSFFVPGVVDVFCGRVDNDPLNTLFLEAGLSARSVALIRTYCFHLWQVIRLGSRTRIMEAVASLPDLALKFWYLFEIKFSPSTVLSLEERKSKFAAGLAEYKESLRGVHDIYADRILRGMVSMLESTVRTNFYLNTKAISLKVRSDSLDIMPRPRPLFEIFVNAPNVEGIHLRTAKVARGGIRWSDRHEDFRSEVLGLVKTQKIKNVVIVPSGSKGGFVLKSAPANPEQLKESVVEAYRTFIRGLLSITDNRVDGEIKHPEGLIIYDEPDPYLVVAADKGTAKFSDIANKVAVDEYNFWLGDAFASGGSNGYDHKIYGITAGGTWECVKRHFKDINLNYETESFSVVGIGDMAGDVFGNGLLMSDNMKLIAAFNHKHIFIDPLPDPKLSFIERKRLFELSGSQWSDYDEKLISNGGGIFLRSSKEIKLSEQMRECLGAPESVPETINGEQLISLILQAPCDLLWNGGIGTYVKGANESHADVDDSTNDSVRVNASNLRARVIGEGGNLGFTQRARIEYSRHGGSGNTDAIDNSGGVDLSDHEVNLKILLRGIVKDGKLSPSDRDALLKEMAPEVCTMVLEHNRSHALLLSLSTARSSRRIEYYKNLIRELVRAEYLDRGLDFLPEDDELDRRAQSKEGLTRPELAVCVAATKMWLKDALLASELLGDPILKEFLLEYFPTPLREKYRNEIFAHPLAKEIIAMQVVNFIVDKMGPTFVHRMATTHSVAPVNVVKAFLAAVVIIQSHIARIALVNFDTFNSYPIFIKSWQALNRAIHNTTSWLIKYHGMSLRLEDMVDFYHKPFSAVLDKIENIFCNDALLRFNKLKGEHINSGMSSHNAKLFAVYPEILTIMGMIWSSKKSRVDCVEAASTYFEVMDALGVERLLALEDIIEPKDKWESYLLVSAANEIREGVAILTATILNRDVKSHEEISRFISEVGGLERVRYPIEEFGDTIPTIPAFSVIGKNIQLCCKEASAREKGIV